MTETTILADPIAPATPPGDDETRQPCRRCGKLLTERMAGNALGKLLDVGLSVRQALAVGPVCIECARRWEGRSRLERLRCIAELGRAETRAWPGDVVTIDGETS